MIRDYLQPLGKLPPIRNPPQSGQLPFAARGIQLEVVGSGLIAGSGSVGFALRNEADHLRRLGWSVESRLARINRKGRTIAMLGTRTKRLEAMKGAEVFGENYEDFVRHVAGNPALYRMDIQFRLTGSSKVLGEFSTYARLVRPRTDLRVSVDQWAVAPGELATARFTNLGTVPFITSSYDFGFGVQAFTGTRWVRVPDNPVRLVPKIRRDWTLGAGMEKTGCLRYLVPRDQAPGLFRFRSKGPEGEELAAEFEVVASPPGLFK